jgi:hypothetical protein
LGRGRRRRGLAEPLHRLLVSCVLLGDQFLDTNLEGFAAFGDGQEPYPVQACQPPCVVAKLVAKRRVVLDRAQAVEQACSFGLRARRATLALFVELFPELGAPFIERSLQVVQALFSALSPYFTLLASCFARGLMLFAPFVTSGIPLLAPFVTPFEPRVTPPARRGRLSGYGERYGAADQQAPRAEPMGGLHALPPGERRQDGSTLAMARN